MAVGIANSPCCGRRNFDTISRLFRRWRETFWPFLAPASQWSTCSRSRIIFGMRRGSRINSSKTKPPHRSIEVPPLVSGDTRTNIRPIRGPQSSNRIRTMSMDSRGSSTPIPLKNLPPPAHNERKEGNAPHPDSPFKSN
ncbi:hypothetical protein B0H19DRAFT_1192181 [Mycena capillaripes]|nr:hypothetical protein B0H19DRAFT_1192181 [Mycena capillaripes]